MIIVITIMVTVEWGAGALKSCGTLWFIRTCSPSASALGHILQCVKLFVSGSVAQWRVEKWICVWVNSSAELGLKSEPYDTTLGAPVNPHAITSPPCRHFTEKLLTITGCCGHNFSDRGSEHFLKCSVIYGRRRTVYNLGAFASG